MRALARALLDARIAVRFRLWIARFRFELWRHGGRLVVEAPHGAEFDGPPVIKASTDGSGSATTVLRLGRGVRLGRDMTIEVWAQGDNLLQVGDTGRFLNNVRIALRSGSVTFGDLALVRDGVWIKADGTFVAGEEVPIGPGGRFTARTASSWPTWSGSESGSASSTPTTRSTARTSTTCESPLKLAPVRISRARRWSVRLDRAQGSADRTELGGGGERRRQTGASIEAGSVIAGKPRQGRQGSSAPMRRAPPMSRPNPPAG